MDLNYFKNTAGDREVIVFGSGPSVNKLSENTLDSLFISYDTIGTNEFIHFPKKVDYYFIGDALHKNRGYNSEPEAYNNYMPKRAKFFRNSILKKVGYNRLPLGIPNVIYYDCTELPENKLLPNSRLNGDLLYDCFSISFEAIQFALLSGYKKIYLAGMDCDYSNGTFHSDVVKPEVIRHNKKVLKVWSIFAYWVGVFYPDVEIFSINPVKMNLFQKVII